MLLEIIQAHDFVWLFLLISQSEDQAYVTVIRPDSEYKPVSASFFHVWQFLLCGRGPRLKDHHSLVRLVFFSKSGKNIASKNETLQNQTPCGEKKKHQAVAIVSLSSFNKILLTVYFEQPCRCWKYIAFRPGSDLCEGANKEKQTKKKPKKKKQRVVTLV